MGSHLPLRQFGGTSDLEHHLATTSSRGAFDDDGGPAIRILAYNTRHCRPAFSPLVSERQTARVVTQVAPDIAGLTELYQVPLRDQPDRLVRLTRMHAAFHGVRSAFGGSYGNLLLSPHPVRETARFSLGGRREERGCLLAHVDLDGTTIVVALVHLSLAREVRRAQLVQLAAELPTDRPLVLLGDFNAGAEELEALEPWLHDSEPAPPTYPSLWPMRALDHVLVSEHFKIVSARAWPSLASDHRPLVVDLRLR